MKFLKVIIPIGVAVAALAIFLYLKMTDHTAEFARALYMGDHARVEEMLQAHPSLANSRNLEAFWTSRLKQRIPASGWTPMHVAADMGDKEMIRLLVKHHAKVDARDNRGLTPLLWTAFGGKQEAAAELLSNGADVNARGPDGRTTLDLAKLSLDNDLIRLLRERGAKE